MTNAKRLLIALAIAGGIYGVALGAGSFLYATDLIGTGATHNDCEGYREEIAEEQGIDEQDVDQDEIERRTEACLDSHELTAKPDRPAISSVRSSSSVPVMPAWAGSSSGKWRPRSPWAAAPNTASAIAWQTTSPSECPASPGSSSNLTPPSHNGRAS